MVLATQDDNFYLHNIKILNKMFMYWSKFKGNSLGSL